MLAFPASSGPPGEGSSSSTNCANVCDPSCQSCAQKNAWRDERAARASFLAPLCDGPLRGGPQVVDLHAKLVARLHHVLAEERVGPGSDHPDVEARMALARTPRAPLAQLPGAPPRTAGAARATRSGRGRLDARVTCSPARESKPDLLRPPRQRHPARRCHERPRGARTHAARRPRGAATTDRMRRGGCGAVPGRLASTSPGSRGSARSRLRSRCTGGSTPRLRRARCRAASRSPGGTHAPRAGGRCR